MKCLTYAGVGGKEPRTGKLPDTVWSPKAEERVLCRLDGLCLEAVCDEGWLAER
jgi:hypothetical protein